MIPFALWRETFMNDADLGLAIGCYDQLSPEPGQLLFERLDLKKFYALDILRSYLLATEDTALPPGEWGWHPRVTARLRLYRFGADTRWPRAALHQPRRSGGEAH